MADVDPLSPPDFTKLADRFAASLGEIAQFTILKSDPFKMIESFIALALSIPIALFGEIAAAAGTVIVKTLQNANPQIAQLASLTLSEVFDTEITLGGSGAGAGSQAALHLGEQLIGGILGGAGVTSAGDLTPSFAPAEKLMGTLLGVPIRGWLLEIITEIGSLGQLKLFHELVQDVQHAIGSGRLARVALQPAVHTLIALPAQRKVMLDARPTLLPIQTLMKAWNRGHWSDSDARQELALQGYDDTRIDEILNDGQPRLTPADVALLYHRGVWDQPTSITYLQDTGWDNQAARLLIQLPALAAIDALNNQLIAEYEKGFVDSFIDESEFLANVRPLEAEPLLADLRLKRAQVRKEFTRKNLTLSELDQALDKNVVDLLEWRQRLRDMGYVDDDITILELTRRETAAAKEHQAELRAQAKLDAAQAKADAASAKAAAAAKAKADADAAKLAIQQAREAARATAAAAAEAKREQAAAAALALIQARQDAEQQKLVNDAAAAALRINTQANIEQQTILSQSLIDAQRQLDAAQAASDKAQLSAQQLSDAASAASASAQARAELEEATIQERRAERIAAFDARLALVDQQEAEGILTANAAQKQREQLQELQDEAAAAEQLDELAIQKAVDAAKQVQGDALRKVADAAAQAALLPTAAEKTRQTIAAAAAGKAKLSTEVAAAKLATDAKISAARVAAFNDAAAKYDALLQDLERQRQELQAHIDAGSPPPPGT
jgi:hypothetical protein